MKKYYIKTQYKPGYQATVLSEVTEYEIKELLKNNPELLNNSVTTPTHKRKYFVPKIGEKYYFIDIRGEVKEDINSGARIDNHDINMGNCFATEQDAQDELNRRQALVRIWNNYDDKYSWDIDWSNYSQEKYNIRYNYKYNNFENDYKFADHIRLDTELPYFKSAEDRNQFVEDNRDDLLVVFNIKK